MSEKFDPWKYCKVDRDSLKGNRFVNPPQPPAEDDNKGDGDDGGSGDGGSDDGSGGDSGGNQDITIIDAKDFLILENIICYGSDGKPFEQHDRIAVAKDVVRNAKEFYDKANTQHKHISFTPYQAIVHFEKAGNGLFLPSYALQCNILVALFQNRSDPEVEKVLMQYKNYGPGHGYHNNNTIVDGEGGHIIHYPHDTDFPSDGGTENINQAMLRIPKRFPTDMDRSSSSLEDALKNAVKDSYTKDLTGLKNPRVLIDIAKHFGRTAWSYPAASSRTCSAWLGCGSDCRFVISSGSSLNDYYAARGVRERSEP